jgi:NADP-dependent 3-hydroxy acid dehydrogenase YdfG
LSTPLSGVAVVTGSSSGIGRAVADALAAQGLCLCLTGRDADRLRSAAQEIGARGRRVLTHQADLSSDEGIRSLVERVTTDLGRVDVLVHAAGTVRLGNVEAAGWDDLDEQYRINLRAPFLVTKALLALLKESSGQVVFVNSSAGLRPGVDNGIYAATKQALHSIAGSLRDQVNPYGVRVLSVYPGRTATPMQARVHHFEGRPYDGAALLQPSDVADMIVAALALPRTAEVTDIMVRPMNKPSLGRSSQ